MWFLTVATAEESFEGKQHASCDEACRVTIGALYNLLRNGLKEAYDVWVQRLHKRSRESIWRRKNPWKMLILAINVRYYTV